MFKTHLEFEEASKIPGKISEQQLIEFLNNSYSIIGHKDYFGWIDGWLVKLLQKESSVDILNQVFDPFINLLKNGDISLEVANLMVSKSFHAWRNYADPIMFKLIHPFESPPADGLRDKLYILVNQYIISILHMMPEGTDFQAPFATIVSTDPLWQSFYFYFKEDNTNKTLYEFIRNCIRANILLPRPLLDAFMEKCMMSGNFCNVDLYSYYGHEEDYVSLLNYKYFPHSFHEFLYDSIALFISKHTSEYTQYANIDKTKKYLSWIVLHISADARSKLLNALNLSMVSSSSKRHYQRCKQLIKMLQTDPNDPKFKK